jgi:hypothetical protein
MEVSMAQKRRGKGPKSAAKPKKKPSAAKAKKKKPKNYGTKAETGQYKLTGYPAELTAQVDKLVAALPPGSEARDKLNAEITAPKPNPPMLRRWLQFIIDNKKEFAELAIELATVAMKKLIQWSGSIQP